jgi:hypothetical protein
MARCVVGKGQHSLHRSDAANTIERCVWSMRPALLIVARVPYAHRVKDTASPPAKPRRVSAVLHPLPNEASEESPSSRLSALASHPILWGDWSRCQPRRAWIGWLRRHLVTVHIPPVSPSAAMSPLLSRAQRAHWRLAWPQRLTRNARPPTALPIEVTVYGLSSEFAQILGLPVA